MPLYEHVFLVRQDVSTQQVETLTKEFSDLIEQHEGKVARDEYWGLKSLSYKIKKSRKAHYVMLNIDAPYPAVAEMERLMQLNADILRFLTLRVDTHETDPSAMMRKDDRRDDRRSGPGGGRGGPRSGGPGGPRGGPGGPGGGGGSTYRPRPRDDAGSAPAQSTTAAGDA